jgi:hypothetical protein
MNHNYDHVYGRRVEAGNIIALKYLEDMMKACCQYFDPVVVGIHASAAASSSKASRKLGIPLYD